MNLPANIILQLCRGGDPQLVERRGRFFCQGIMVRTAGEPVFDDPIFDQVLHLPRDGRAGDGKDICDLLAGQSRVPGEQPEDRSGGIGPEIMEHHLLGLGKEGLVPEVPHDSMADETGDLARRNEPCQVIPESIFIDARQIGESLHFDARLVRDGLVEGISCGMLQHILLRNSPISAEEKQAEWEQERRCGSGGNGNRWFCGIGKESGPPGPFS